MHEQYSAEYQCIDLTHRQYFINFGGISCDYGRVYVYMMTVLVHEKFQGWGSSSPPATNAGFFMHMTCPEKGLAGMITTRPCQVTAN